MSRAPTGTIGDFASGNTSYTNVAETVTAVPLTATQIVVGGVFDQELSNAQMVASWVSQLGITMEQLNAFDTTLGIANGSALYYSVEAQAGDFLSVWVDFVANDYMPYDDFAFFSASSESLATPDIAILGRIDVDKDPIFGTGEMGSTGYYNLTYTFDATGLYTLGFGVVNTAPGPLDLDPGSPTYDPYPLWSDSALLLDQNNAPEPSTWLLALSAAGAVLLMRRRQAGGRG